MTIAGSCRCGACRYELDFDVVPAVYACHCLDCQTITGSAFTLQAAIPEARLRSAGPTAAWSHANSSGATVTHRVCEICFTRLHSVNDKRPGAAILRAGTLEDSAAIVPVAHMWVRRKQPWIHLDPDVPAFDEWIPGDQLTALLGRNFN